MQPKNLSDHSVLDKSVLAPAAQPASVLDDSVSADAVLKDSVLKEDFALKGRGFKPRRKYRKIDRGFSRCGRILAATRMQPWLLVWVLGANLGQVCAAQDIHAPTSVPAGEDTHFITTGSDKATFYLVGPGVSSKSDVELARGVRIPAQSVRNAGNYLAILCSDTCRSATFYVTPARPATLTLLVHPSRVPVGQNDAVSGVALPFDQFHNLVIAPYEVNFQLTSGNSSVMSRAVRTLSGIAWFRTSSGKNTGILQVNAALNAVTSRRAVQQVASDPCNLRIKGQRTSKGIVVETEPVRDCSGNPVPDGTIVTFTASSENTKSSVDAPIKRGIARAQMEAPGATTISAASGVVMGNDLRIGAQP